MDKKKFFDQLIEALRAEALHAIKASQDAADYATNEESRAESQWDTQGLEASYLAAGQANQARHRAEAVEEMQSNREIFLKTNTDISLGALFTCDFGGVEESFFFSSVAGGRVISIDGKEVTVITAQSPLAVRLRGLKAGDAFALPNGKSSVILAIE
ncbi:MAG: transcription elongation GreA/GreB family factor [Lentimonas sp.]|jgi:transcription elongation GreA/GreB family factor